MDNLIQRNLNGLVGANLGFIELNGIIGRLSDGSFFTILASSACAQTNARNTDHVGAVMTAAASVSNVTI